MQRFIRQAKHNQSFHDCLIEHYPRNFFDWKITVIFYISVHGIRAFAIKYGKDIGQTHYEIKNKMTQLIRQGEIPMTEDEWKIYTALYQSSQAARYDGITDDEQSFEMALEIDYTKCVIELDKLKVFFKKRGININ